jgi:subtilisin family serine protease
MRRVNRASGESFKPDAPEAKGQLEQVAAEQAAHLQAMSRALGRSVEPTHLYMVTHSGIAARLTPAEADIVRSQPGVDKVERERVYDLDTYRGPALIGAPSIWNGTAVPSGTGTRGKGIVIAVLDSGVEASHPAFANDPACGHGQAGAPVKLISFLDCASATGPGGLCNGPTPTDPTSGHGTHTTSTAGGNTLTQATTPPPPVPAGYTDISGVAPCASLRTYRVCPTTCPAADIQAGMNSVLLHGDASVMNFSISGGTNPYTDNDRKKLDLVDAGIVVAASAGNTSATITNPVGNVNHRGPWVMTVAASTHDGQLEAVSRLLGQALRRLTSKIFAAPKEAIRRMAVHS